MSGCFIQLCRVIILMNNQELIDLYNQAVYDTDRDAALEVIHGALKAGKTPEEIVFEIIIPALDQTVKMIENDDSMCLAQHFMTSQIASEVVDEMLPLFKTETEHRGTVVIGSAFGDLHSLGKRIVAGCLRANMIEVFDLGVNVPAERFIDEAILHHAEVIAVSSMMMHTARGDRGALGIRKILEERSLSQIRLVVGGAPFRFNPELYKIVQADAWAPDGVSASRVIWELIKEVRG